MEDHFVEVTDMIRTGSGARRPLKTLMMFRYVRFRHWTFVRHWSSFNFQNATRPHRPRQSRRSLL